MVKPPHDPTPGEKIPGEGGSFLEPAWKHNDFVSNNYYLIFVKCFVVIKIHLCLFANSRNLHQHYRNP